MDTGAFQLERAAASIPAIEGRAVALLYDGERAGRDCLIALVEPGGEREPFAFVDGETACVYPLGTGDGSPSASDPRTAGERPVVIVTGDLEGETGQVKILEDDGVYRRYSRWDKVDPDDFPDHPEAYLQSLPQCGCGGYLGAPTVFPSFEEMVAYFYTVFTYAR